ncbi:aminotransferase class I/II-fold pyridoxal phosphate-dependent enzyme [Blastopirellula sp. JC732]|uniref:Aminotransferase class I/II-fold pyridoxal phosphate-dependent enzyme n=1 Tax=Blastopirellula sediminis TaxID=2894196 RepID=A0A9X1SFX0_9BACT|nr:aminotransferase class I/II-fold pyridoxal phosphate-dependent enzyme [Blastopirellula sediminis]MCC9608440.1 aminotransferase class I/II-fold pyridoxal phosphate-dependent enzyme [Blastopirellula sediminis]MCC9628783.1 aminotransferase class I/II-fold pyridoxal phosphate-dependent enzyme [Blastopirellula sediminis]
MNNEVKLLSMPHNALAVPLHVGRPNIGDQTILMERIQAIFDGNWLTNDGPLVREFEQRVADLVGVRHCIAMCNGTVALEIAIRAVGLKGEVIVPSYTFVATAHALQWQEITPVFCDVDPQTQNLDPTQVERLITPRTSGIIGVHLWGRPCDVAALEEIAERRNLALMFDAAHAFGCSHEGKMIGSFGRCEVFSFHATKFVHCGEGGAIVTDDDELADKVRLMRNFGFSGYDNVVYLGTNGKMNELNAAVGLSSLEGMPQFIDTNQRNYACYEEAILELPGLRLLEYPKQERQNYQYVVVDVDPSICPLSRDQLVQILHAHNVLARRYFFPGVHRMEPYCSFYPNAGLLLPVTEQLANRVLVLPTGTSVTAEDIDAIGSIFAWAAENAGELRERLARTVPQGESFDAEVSA